MAESELVGLCDQEIRIGFGAFLVLQASSTCRASQNDNSKRLHSLMLTSLISLPKWRQISATGFAAMEDTSSSESEDDIVADAIVEVLQLIHSDRYINERRDIPKTAENLRLLLDVYRHEYPDIFRRAFTAKSVNFQTPLHGTTAEPQQLRF